MRVEREALDRALKFLSEDGYVIVESVPRAGLTLFLSQVGGALSRLEGTEVLYINSALSQGSLREALANRLAINPEDIFGDLTNHMRSRGSLLLLLDRVDMLECHEQNELFSFLEAFRADRLFDSSLHHSFLAVGVCASIGKASVQLDFFSVTETAALLHREPEDEVCQALYSWSQGSPELAQELSRELLMVREASANDVYLAVDKQARRGRLGSVVRRRLSDMELWREGLMRRNEGNSLVPVPALALAMRRVQSEQEELGIVIDRRAREVRYRGKLIPLFPRENLIFCLLAAHPGQVFSPAQIHGQLNPDEAYGYGENSIKAQMSRLRKKLPPEEQWIITKRGFGYAFNPQAPIVFTG